MKEGRYSNAAKLDIHQVREIQKRYGTSDVTMKELANEFNVTMTTICRLVKDVDSDNKKEELVKYHSIVIGQKLMRKLQPEY